METKTVTCDICQQPILPGDGCTTYANNIHSHSPVCPVDELSNPIVVKPEAGDAPKKAVKSRT